MKCPNFSTTLINENIERRVFAMQTVVNIVRVVRERKNIALKVSVLCTRSIYDHPVIVSITRNGRHPTRYSVSGRFTFTRKLYS